MGQGHRRGKAERAVTTEEGQRDAPWEGFGFKDGGRRQQAKEWGQTLNPGKSKETVSSLELPKRNTALLILAQSDPFQTSDLRTV